MARERATGDGVDSATIALRDPSSEAEANEGGLESPDRRDHIRAAGERVGRYVIDAVLGRGGMGVVYRARDEALLRPVAVKVLRIGSSGEAHVARLRREAQALAQLSHPNVVTVYEVGLHDGDVYIAMELVEGTPLDAWLAEKPRAWTEVVNVMLAAGQGLAAAHARGLVHRDFKPGNVVRARDGRTKVLDFGLARGVGEEGPTAATPEPPRGRVTALADDHSGLGDPLTEAGTVMGTLAYMAPELYELEEADARSDQYAFGVALYEGVFGRRPYRAPSRGLLRQRIAAGELGDRPAGPVPAAVWRVIARALAVDPAARHRDMDAMLDALARAARPSSRWRWAVAGLAVLSFASAAAWQGAPPRCDDASRLHGVWDPARRAALRDAIHATKLPYAGATWSQVERSTDEFTDRWLRVRGSVCRAGQSDAQLDARMQCLDRALVRISTVLDALATPDPARTQRAVPAMSRLPAPESCLGDLSFDQPPAGSVKEVTAIAAALAEIEARQTVAPDPALRGEAEALAQRAALTEHAPLIADVLAVAGQIQRDAGDYVQARATMEEAFWTAQQAGADTTAAGAGAMLVYLLAHHLSDLPEARSWARHAQGAFERIEGDTTGVEPALRNSLGVMHERAGDMPAALADYARVEALARATAESSLVLATALGNRGNVLLALGRIEEATELHEHAAQMRENLLGPDHPEVATGLADLASVYAGQGAMSEALAASERAVAIADAALGSDHPQVAMMLANQATIHERMGSLADAAATYERALEAAKKALGEDHPHIAIILHNLGGVRRLQGRLDEAIALLEDSHARLEATWGANHEQLGASLINLGLAHLEDGQHERALAEFQRSMAIAEAAYGHEHDDVATAANHIGDALRALGRAAQAKDMHTEAVNLWTLVHSDSAGVVAIGLTGVGLDLLALEQPVAAQNPLRRAVVIADASTLPATVGADARRALASALAAGDGDPAEIRGLAIAARDTYLQSGGAGAKFAEEVDAWLQAL